LELRRGRGCHRPGDDNSGSVFSMKTFCSASQYETLDIPAGWYPTGWPERQRPADKRGARCNSIWSDGGSESARITGGSSRRFHTNHPANSILGAAAWKYRRHARTRRDGTGRVDPAQGLLVRERTRSGCTDSSRSSDRPAPIPFAPGLGSHLDIIVSARLRRRGEQTTERRAHFDLSQ
jgi:hypothetical protein